MNALGLTGGGCLGIGQALALQKLESYGTPCYKLFDIIGGTSVGSINGACLSIGVQASDIMKFFQVDAPKIFSSNFLSETWTVLTYLGSSAKYNPSQLETSLQNILGNSTLADCKTKFIATAVDMKTGKNVYFQSYGKSSEDVDEIIVGPDSNIKLWEVVRMSSSAQSYFPAYTWNNIVGWDGGSSGCNSPDMLLYTECKNWTDDIQMLSILCGYADWPFANQSMVNPSIINVAKATLYMVYKCVQNNAIWQAQSILKDNHVLLNTYLGKGFNIDDASPSPKLLN